MFLSARRQSITKEENSNNLIIVYVPITLTLCLLCLLLKPSRLRKKFVQNLKLFSYWSFHEYMESFQYQTLYLKVMDNRALTITIHIISLMLRYGVVMVTPKGMKVVKKPELNPGYVYISWVRFQCIDLYSLHRTLLFSFDLLLAYLCTEYSLRRYRHKYFVTNVIMVWFVLTYLL